MKNFLFILFLVPGVLFSSTDTVKPYPQIGPSYHLSIYRSLDSQDITAYHNFSLTGHSSFTDEGRHLFICSGIVIGIPLHHWQETKTNQTIKESVWEIFHGRYRQIANLYNFRLLYNIFKCSVLFQESEETAYLKFQLYGINCNFPFSDGRFFEDISIGLELPLVIYSK